MRRIKIILMRILNVVINKNHEPSATDKSRQESLLRELTRLNGEITNRQIQADIL